MYEHIENFRRNANYVKNQKEILEIKIITSEMENSSDRLFSIYGTAEKRLSELKDRSVEIDQLKYKKKKSLKKKTVSKSYVAMGLYQMV